MSSPNILFCKPSLKRGEGEVIEEKKKDIPPAVQEDNVQKKATTRHSFCFLSSSVWTVPVQQRKSRCFFYFDLFTHLKTVLLTHNPNTTRQKCKHTQNKGKQASNETLPARRDSPFTITSQSTSTKNKNQDLKTTKSTKHHYHHHQQQ